MLTFQKTALTVALGFFTLLGFERVARAECPSGSYPCGSSWCTPNGGTCCASVGLPSQYCENGQQCNADGTCGGSSGGGGGGCEAGYEPCGSDYCSPVGSTCCASVGRPDRACSGGLSCNADGTCGGGGSVGGGGGPVTCGYGETATLANCGGDVCGCADPCTSDDGCQSGCCAEGFCSPPCVCEGGGELYDCGATGGLDEPISGGCAMSSDGGASSAGLLGLGLAAALMAFRRRAAKAR